MLFQEQGHLLRVVCTKETLLKEDLEVDCQCDALEGVQAEGFYCEGERCCVLDLRLGFALADFQTCSEKVWRWSCSWRQLLKSKVKPEAWTRTEALGRPAETSRVESAAFPMCFFELL